MIRYALSLTRGFRGRMSVSAGTGILRVIAGLFFVAVCKHAVDIATGNASGRLGECVAWLVTILVVELLCSAMGSRATDLSEAEMKNCLQERLFGRLLTAVWTGRDRFHSGDSLSRLTDDCRVVSESLCRAVPAAAIALIQLTGAFLFLWYFSPLLAIMLLVILPLSMFAGRAFFRRMRRLTREIRALESRLQGMMQESLYHRVLLLTCRQTARMIETVAGLNHSRLRLIRRRTDITVYSRAAVFAGFEAGYLAAFLWGIYGLAAGTVSFGTMTAYLQLAGLIQRPLAELARLIPGLIQSHTAFCRMAEIDSMTVEDSPQSIIQAGSGQPVGLSLDNVTFGYPGGVPVFTHFSHTFRPGSRTVIVGETGAGKSTLLLLMLALIRPIEGDIEIFTHSGEGRVSAAVSPATRDQFVYVPQGNSLLSGTIRDNLRLGKPDATDEEMREALHCAAADFVFGLRSGLDTICGEHGDGLSEGQAQRIAVARGLLRPAPIVLLDEITSSLDEATERLLLERLFPKLGSRTVIMVTHRPAVVPYFDDVVSLM